MRFSKRFIQWTLVPMPWQGGVRRIRDLSISELTRHGQELMSFAGRNQTARRLIYRALELEPRYTAALRMMSGFFETGLLSSEPEKAVPISAALLEYAMRFPEPNAPGEQDSLKEAKLSLMARLGWVQLKGEKVHEIHSGDYTAYEADELAYAAYVVNPIQRAGGLKRLFKVAHAMLGVYAGLLISEAAGNGVYEWLDPDKCTYSREYRPWLLSDAQRLIQSHYERRRTASQLFPG